LRGTKEFYLTSFLIYCFPYLPCPLHGRVNTKYKRMMKKSIPKENFQPFEKIDDKINGFFTLVDISKTMPM
jgi:hypothetical protein